MTKPLREEKGGWKSGKKKERKDTVCPPCCVRLSASPVRSHGFCLCSIITFINRALNTCRGPRRERDKNRPKGMSQIEGNTEEKRERVGEVMMGCERRKGWERKG